jgi:hypothetical protein
MRNESELIAYKRDWHMCMENKWQCTSHTKTCTLLIFRRRRRHNSTTTTNSSLHTHGLPRACMHTHTPTEQQMKATQDTSTGNHLNITGHTHFLVCHLSTTPPFLQHTHNSSDALPFTTRRQMPAPVQGPMASFTSHRHLLHSSTHLYTHSPSPSPPSPPLFHSAQFRNGNDENERIYEFEPSRRSFFHLSRIFWNSFHVSCNIFPAKPRHSVWGSLR